MELDNLISRERYEDWQGSVIFETNRFRNQDGKAANRSRRTAGANQAELIRTVEAGTSSTATYLLKRCGSAAASDLEQVADAVPILPNPLTPGEMKHLPKSAERAIAEHLGDVLTPGLAAEPPFWALCHAVWIDKGLFGNDLPAVFLDGEQANTSEAKTRNFLRRTGGLRRVRGNTSVFTDCPVATAWWRWRLAGLVSSEAEREGESLDQDSAHTVLYPRLVWEELVTMSLKKITVILAPRARAAAVVALRRHAEQSSHAADRDQLQNMAIHIARLGHSYDLSVVPWQELLDAADRGLAETAPPNRRQRRQANRRS